ncbi:MAG: four helix bundle protein [Ruminococcus sp.]|nr:four helix bundle protein [Ruminococcus sp.]
MKGELADYSIRFAIRIVNYYKWLTEERREFVMARQILRSGTSIGANIHESNFAASRNDFRNKLRIAAKEASETEYWLIVLEKTGYFDKNFLDLKPTLTSIIKMLTATLKNLDDDDDET